MTDKTAVKKIRKTLQGVAKNDAKNKTVAVLISRVRVHPIYGKRFTVSNTILAHTDEPIQKGQLVTIEETRSLSKNKAFRVVK